MGKIIRFIGLGVFLVVSGCTSVGETTETALENKENTEVGVDDASVDLASYLRQISGLRVQGSGSSAMVFVRGTQSVNNSNQPLFVVDGSRIGRTFSQVESFVDVNDIASIEVLKGNEASSRYGMAGSNGVVLIHTKKK